MPPLCPVQQGHSADSEQLQQLVAPGELVLASVQTRHVRTEALNLRGLR